MKKRIRYLFIIILLLSSFIIINVSFSKAKYLTIIDGAGSAEIAKPVFEITQEDEKEVEVYDGIKSIEYKFSVSNNKDTELTDVELKYVIEIINSTKDFPIEYSLYKNDEKIELENNKTQPMLLKNNQNVKDEYKLNIVWKEKEGENSSNDDIKIKIEAIQKV